MILDVEFRMFDFGFFFEIILIDFDFTDFV